MNLGLSADEVLTTTRAVRKRIDFDRPVEREVIEECVQIATQAPSGSNSQGWQWVFVTDPEKKATIAEYYNQTFWPYLGIDPETDQPTGDSGVDIDQRIAGSAAYLAKRLHEVPVMAIPLHAGRVDGAESFMQASVWGSILPAVWSFLLALRERGLGSSWTTLHLPFERQVSELLGIPYDEYTQAGLFPIGYTIGTDFKPARRNDITELMHWDAWGTH